MKWDDTITRRDAAYEESGIYHMTVGTFTVEAAPDLERYLSLGSRLVFLIDWNRARKRLRPFLPKVEVLALLRWAADNDLGHEAFCARAANR